ncbi:MAG: preprotein translocase subunit YajC [Micromonosporaceae bacterium]
MFVAQTGGSGGGLLPFLMIGLIIAAMYFFMIRPQQRQRRQTQEMQSKLGVGDQVITIGGLYGTVVEADDEAVTLEVAPGVTNKYLRGAVSRVVSPTEGESDAADSGDGKDGDKGGGKSLD